MYIINIFLFLLIGAIMGLLVGRVTRGHGFGQIDNIILGIIGSMVGGLVFNLFGFFGTGRIGSIIIACIGAALLPFLVGFLKKK